MKDDPKPLPLWLAWSLFVLMVTVAVASTVFVILFPARG